MQIYNLKKQTREKERFENGIPDSKTRKDRIYSMMLMAYQDADNAEESFIHGIAAWPCVFLDILLNSKIYRRSTVQMNFFLCLLT